MSYMHTKYEWRAFSEINIVDIKINNHEISIRSKKIIQR